VPKLNSRRRERILGLHFGDPKRYDIGAVLLPTMERIETEERLSVDRPLRYLYEPEMRIKRASMEHNLAGRLGCSVYGPFLTPEDLITSAFFDSSFTFLSFFERSRLKERPSVVWGEEGVLREKCSPKSR
jgi:hypothetical protein